MSEDKKRDELIKLNEQLASYYQNLAYAVNDESGKKILVEINSQLNDLNLALQNVALKPLSAPYYEYEKDDLQSLKAFRSKIDGFNQLLGSLNPEGLMAKATKCANKAESLREGEPLEAKY